MTHSKLNRRQFLKACSAVTCGSVVHGAVGPLTKMDAFAAPAPQLRGLLGSHPLLIFINFGGGISMNWMPLASGAYIDRMRDIVPSNPLPINGQQGFHPALSCFKQIFDEGDLAVMNSVGLGQSRSHSDATDEWYLASFQNGMIQEGWLGRLAYQLQSFFGGISLSGSSLLTNSGSGNVRPLGDLTNFGESRFKWSDIRSKQLRDLRDALMSHQLPYNSANAQLVVNSNTDMDKSVKVIADAVAGTLPTVSTSFPNTSFGRACRDAARIAMAGESVKTRVITLNKGGFDTHSDEPSRLTSLLNDVDQSVCALVETLKALGRWNDTAILTMSEFHRTFQNASLGTDHGRDGVHVVMGGRVNGRLVNAPPSSAVITQANGFLDHREIDFRFILKDVIGAMGYNVDAVFPGAPSHNSLGLFA